MKPSTETKTEEKNDAHGAAAEAAKGAAVGAGIGAGVGAGLWGLAAPVAGLFGFGANGIVAGSTAASMMSAAAVANGGGVAAGSTVAVLQSVGAVGLATPVGLGLVAGGLVVGGTVVGVTALLTKRGQAAEGEETMEDTKAKEDSQDPSASESASWVLLEWPSMTADPVQTLFRSETEAREAYNNSSSAKRQLCRSDLTCIEHTPDCSP